MAKICYYECSNIFGGLENVVVSSVNLLADNINHEVAIILHKDCKFMDKFNKKVKIYVVNFNNKFNPFLYLKVLSIAKKYDILHSHGSKASKIFYLINLILNKTLVATKHNDRKGKIFDKIKNTIAVSNTVAKTINHNSKVIYFGIELNAPQPPIKIEDTFKIVCVGRLDKLKGFDILIKALVDKKFNFFLDVIGEGNQMQNLQQLADKLNIKNIKFHGFCNNVGYFLKQAHLHIIPSRKEGFGLIGLEAIKYSNLTLAANTGGLREIFDDKFLFSLNELSAKIDCFCQNYYELSNDFYHFKCSNLDKFNIKNFYQNLENYYRSVYETY